MDIIYSVNGKYFKQWGINVEKSSGFGGLKRKDPEKYEFADQNGVSLDLSNPYFEAREIKLECWIKGANWNAMYYNFLQFMAEFKKPETQRLVIEYPYATTRIYQVYCPDEVELKARIKKGVMFATFEITLVEPNPIKKVFIGYGSYIAMLKYTSPEETEIFLPKSVKRVANGDVDMQLNLKGDSEFGSYAFKWRNFLRGSWEFNSSGKQELEISQSIYNGKYYFKFDECYFEDGNDIPETTLEFRPAWGGYPSVYVTLNLAQGWDNVEVNLTSPVAHKVILWNRKIGSTVLQPDLLVWLSQASLTKQKVDFWTAAPEDVKYVVVAGTISKVTNVIFSGGTLWNEL